MDKQIQALRTFFRISTAAFEFARIAAEASGGKFTSNPMIVLHKMALEELEKENPDTQKVDYLLAQMEELAIQNAAKNG